MARNTTKIAHCTEETRESIPTQLAQFSDGDPCIDEFQGPPLELDAGFGPSSISHRFANAKAGFDNAAFAGPESFKKILDEHNLSEQPIVIDTGRDEYDLFEYGAYVWVNTEVLLVTKYNPLTGRCVKPFECQSPEPGAAHYIGIEGEKPAVESLYQTISSRLSNGSGVKGERRYI
jgi:hypothetical protein